MDNEKNILDHLKSREINTPDTSYFKEIAKVVADSQKPKIVPIYRRPIFWISSAAAAVVISMTLLNIGNNPVVESDSLLAMNDIPQDEILTYVDEHIDEFDLDMISEIINEDSLGFVDIIDVTNQMDIPAEKITEINFEEIDPDDILNYLENQGIGIDELEDESIYLNL